MSHIRVGEKIFVTVAGSRVNREAVAIGIEDLPAVYRQIVRSIITGRPVESFTMVDRANVTASQGAARRVNADSFGYARLGYGGLFGNRTYGTPALGFGYRVELDRFGVDVAFLNLQIGSNSSAEVSAGSVLKLSGLYFIRPDANRTGYLGAGLSWGGSSFGNDSGYDSYSSGFSGSGLQAELSGGYEFARATPLRIFVQVDATLPFYSVISERYTFPRAGSLIEPTIMTSHRYAPSFVASVGMGWQRNRK